MIDEQEEQGAKPRTPFWKELPVLLGVAVVVAVLVRAFILQTFFIPSESMEHTLNIDDRVLVNKLVYDFRDPRRGEIVVFHAPDSWKEPGEEDFIKRVIGTPGDRVVCCDSNGWITVNGRALDETSYLYRGPNGEQDAPSQDIFNIVVPPDRLWVMGDHRSRSGDSRAQYMEDRDLIRSTIPIDSVVGRAFVLFWPFSRAHWLSVPDTYDQIPAPSAG